MLKCSSVSSLLLVFAAHCVFANVSRDDVPNIFYNKTTDKPQTNDTANVGCVPPSLCLQNIISQKKVDKPRFNGTASRRCVLPSHCYKGKYYYFETDVKRTRDEAQSYCRSMNSELLSLQTAEKDAYFFNLIKGSSACVLRKYWISGIREGNNRFYWSTGEPFTHINWKFDQPDNWNDNESCVSYLDHYAQWNDLNCDEKIYYICESDCSC